MINDGHFDDDEWVEFLKILFEGDPAELYTYLRENASTARAAGLLLEAVPRTCAAMIRRFAPDDVTADVDLWSFGAGGPDADQATTQVGQLVTAALNRDPDVITGIRRAVLDAPEEHLAAVIGQLLTVCRMIYRERPTEQ